MCNVQMVQTAKVCAKGPGEECGGLWNTGGTCGDGLRNPLNSSVEYENGSRSLALYIKIVVAFNSGFTIMIELFTAFN